MIKFKCSCGGENEFNELIFTQGKCNYCDNIISIDDYPIGKTLLQGAEDLKARLDKILAAYKKDKKPGEILSEMNAFKQEWEKSGARFIEIWTKFIITAVGYALDNEDKPTAEALKKHAAQYDEYYGKLVAAAGGTVEKDGLYRTLLMTYPGIGTNTDWADMIEKAQGNDKEFTALTDTLIKYIAVKADKSFAIEIFNTIAAMGEKGKKAGVIYLRGLLNDDDIAANVFTAQAFGVAARRFMRRVQKYCNKYLKDGEIDIENSKLWPNFQRKVKAVRRRNIVAAVSVLAIILAACIGFAVWFNSADSDSVTFSIDEVIEVTYGEQPDLSDYTVTYKKKSGEEVTEKITLKMFSGYDPEKIGDQTVTVEYEGGRKTITVRVYKATLETPVLTQSRNSVAWQSVLHAESYDVYVNSTSAVTANVTGVSYDLSANENFGNVTVTVMAKTTSDKYNNSAMSQTLTVEKLGNPSNLLYVGGYLTWDEVQGAARYELSVNSAPYTTTEPKLQVNLLQGDNQISIVAKSDDEKVIDGVINRTFAYHKLDTVTGVTYSDGRVSWTAAEGAGWYDIYVGGELWKEHLARPNFTISGDGADKFTQEGLYKIGIVCGSNSVGTEASEKFETTIAVRYSASMADGVISWKSLDGSATYIISINGEEADTLSLPSFAVSQFEKWKVGNNTVSLTATMGGETIIYEAHTVKKLAAPTFNVSGDNWVAQGENIRYSILKGGDVTDNWVEEIPAPGDFGAGVHTVKAKCAISSDDAFEIESEPVVITLHKLETPAIRVESGKIVPGSGTLDPKYEYSLYISDTEGGEYKRIASLDEIKDAGEYYIKAKLTAVGGKEEGYDLVIESGFSNAVQVIKLAAPTITYRDGQPQVNASSGSNVKFYYMKDGVETELKDGLISELPQGNFEVYARSKAQAANELDSANSSSVTVYNMHITLTLSKNLSNNSQITLIFDGCQDIDSLTYSCELIYYDRNGERVGSKSIGDKTINKDTAVSAERIRDYVNYRLSVVYENGKSSSDIYEIEVTVTIKNDENSQILSPERITVA